MAHADVADPGARGRGAGRAAHAAAAANVAGRRRRARCRCRCPAPRRRPASERVRFDGRLPDGRPVQVQVAVFAQGTRVFQATALGERLPVEAAETFFGSIRFLP